jgi:carbonic anhydrase/acetyltransferase-like protein (isoleucine patch superfamily)
VATLVTFEGKTPVVSDAAFLAPTAVLVGDVVVGSGASVWFGAVLRGDFDRIEVGEGTSVQDNVVLHAAEGLPTLVGRNVTLGHGALLEGCVVEDSAVVGMGCVILQRARIGEGAMIAAGSVVTENQEISAGHLAVGTPARVTKELSGSSKAWVSNAARAYDGLRRRYLNDPEPQMINRESI